MNNVAADDILFVKNIFIVLAFTVVTFIIFITRSVDYFLILDDKLCLKLASHQVQL